MQTFAGSASFGRCRQRRHLSVKRIVECFSCPECPGKYRRLLRVGGQASDYRMVKDRRNSHDPFCGIFSVAGSTTDALSSPVKT